MLTNWSLQLPFSRYKPKDDQGFNWFVRDYTASRWLCYQPGFLASLINRNWSEARQEIQARFCWGPCYSRGEGGQTIVSLAWSLLKGSGELVPYMRVRVGVCPGVGPEGWLRCFSHCLAPSAVHRCVQEACTVPCFCSRFFKSGSWLFGLLVSFVQNWPQLHGHDWATSLSLFTFMPWRRKWQPTPVFLSWTSHEQRSLVGYCP